MSTRAPSVEEVRRSLEDTWVYWWGFSLGTCIVLAGCVSLGVLFLFALIDALVWLPQLVLGILFVVWVGLTLAAGAATGAIAHRGYRSLAATARRIEMEAPEYGSHLINLVEFSEAEEESSDRFRRAALAQATAALGGAPLTHVARRESRWRRLLLSLQTPRDLAEACVLLLAILAFGRICYLAVPTWSSSVSRLVHPWAFVPAVGAVKIGTVTPGDADILMGSEVFLTAEIDNPSGRAYPATLHVRRPGEREAIVEMAADPANRRFTAALPRMTAALDYFVQIGDSQSRLFHLGVCQKPAIADVDVTYRYPEYLGRPAATVAQKHADLEAPQFTYAELHIHPLTPIASGHIEIEGQILRGGVLDGGHTLLVNLLLDRSTTFTVHLVTLAGQTDRAPRVNTIRVLPDAPPTVQLVQPAAGVVAAPGSFLAFVVRAGDDNGLGQVKIEMKRGGTAPPKAASVETVMTWTAFPTPTSALLHHSMPLEKARFQPGEVFLFRAVAQDRRRLEIEVAGRKQTLLPQETATPWQEIKLISSQAKSAAELAQLDQLRAALGKILAQQVKARVAAGGLRQSPADEPRRIAAEVQVMQTAIQKATVAVADSIGRTEDTYRLDVKHAASKLGLGDMLTAIRQAEALARSPKPEEAHRLTTTQDRILDVLRRMINEVRRDTAEQLSQMKERPASDLPPDVRQKLQDLKDKLKEFLDQQKKVIEATENLAKMPAEDFTDKQEKQLQSLAKAEDDWSRFMADKHSDLSKLPEQDFSNPSLLEEMIEVQTELKMAKDALTKKAADIAVPLEQLGAEMAKEITSNIEKWLPDTPDRERWSQEEPLTDAMKEAPMAELPRELEDLVGKLMEEEEDLMDELEDASSSWADSIDKGAGWDAADGPISNMSAKGVTGNRLPNSNEIGGRSGEGRQGKSSGEFVGDSATGKGGRKTPSRLTPEPHMKGQVKDSSKDPTGGATGGGKESGQGGQGLHGPVPDRPERQLERLAGKQAELRNKAETVDLRFQVLRYHHADLKKTIEMMKGVENDLRSGRYQNALRRREVLVEGMGQVRTCLKGEFAIRSDTTPNLPSDIQKEVLGSMQEASPAGWEQLNRQYFDRLGSTPAAALSPAKPLPSK
jgi:hypothetical protein